MYGSHLTDPIYIFTAKNQSVFYISFYRIYQCFCNTIRHCARITFFKTVITFFHRHSGHFQIFYKIISEGSSRHSYRTLYNLDVFFSGINISLLIGIRSITFCGCNKSAGNLNTIRTQIYYMIDILSVKNTPGNDYRNFGIKHFLVYFLTRNNIFDFCIIIKVFYIC